MVSEGVDIPRLRVGVYATVAKTPLIFRQIVGRFVRVIAGRGPELSWLFLPADKGLRALAADVETELRHSLRPPGDDDTGDGLLDDDALERAARLETEPGDAGFVPLAADVAPQLALFAGAEDAAPAATPPRPPIVMPSAVPSADAPPDDEPPLSAFERRAQLRQERHQLVAALRRLDGRSHAEINAAVNKQLGIRSVEKATLDQLQKSIDVLYKELDRTKRRTARRAAGAA
jgi:hypothetical protein